jgi:hypothetical protein
MLSVQARSITCRSVRWHEAHQPSGGRPPLRSAHR